MEPTQLWVGTMADNRTISQLEAEGYPWIGCECCKGTVGEAQAQEGPMTTVWIYVDTNTEVGDADHLKVFAPAELADEWFKKNDPEGVAFGYEVIE